MWSNACRMSHLNRMTRFLHVHIKSQLKNDLTFITWSRGLSTKTHPNESLSDGPIKILQEKISAGELKPDEHQTRVMDELQTLYDTIQSYTPPEDQSSSSLFKWLPLKNSKSRRKINSPKGLYIYGSVGGGKTTLMDLFYNSCHSVSLYKSNNLPQKCWIKLCILYFVDIEEEANPFQFVYDGCACTHSHG